MFSITKGSPSQAPWRARKHFLGGLRTPSNCPLPPLEIPHDNAPVMRLELDREPPPSMGLDLNMCTVAGCSRPRLGLDYRRKVQLARGNAIFI